MTSANKLSIETVISVVALVLSVIATTASVYFSRLGARTEVLPTLVFVYSADSGWFLRNVGNGPALNVLVAAELDSASGWTTPTQLYPVPEGERTWIQWVGHYPERLAAIYSDAHNR